MAERVAMLVRNTFTHDTRVEKEARTLTDAGYAVTVVADAGRGLPHREMRDGVDIVRVARTARRIPGLRFAIHEWRLAGVLTGLRPDVLHAHDSNALLPVAIAARQARVPFVLDAHELWLGRPPRGRPLPYRLAYQAWYTVLERLLVVRAAAVVTVSAPIARHYERVYRLPRVDLVPNFPEIDRPVERRELRDLAPAIPADAPIVLHLGAYLPDRGLEQLVDALPAVPDAHLVVLGAGERAKALVDRAAPSGAAGRVHPLPPVPPGQVVDYAASATIGVAPIVPTTLNNRYSLPNKLFQYMAAGIGVLASDLPQMRDVVVTSGAGRVVDTSDTRAVATELRALLADRDALVEMGRRGRQAVESRYSWNAAAATLLAVYGRVLGRQTPAP